MLVDLIATPCTLILRSDTGTADELGDATRAETEIETVCAFQQVQATEPVAEGEISVTVWQFFFLATAPEIRTGDAVRIADAGMFEFVGDAWRADTMGSVDMHHVEVRAKQTTPPERAS